MQNIPHTSDAPAYTDSVWKARVILATRTVRQNWSIFIGTRVGLIGLVIIAFYALLALSHPLLMNTVWEPSVYDPVVGYSFDEVRQPAPPSRTHLLGTDPLGRDILSQLMFSARAEFLLGLLAAIVTVTIGTTVGAVAAYFGGVVDMLLMRLADIMIMMPGISVLIVLSALIGVEHFELALIIGILSGFGGTGVVLKSQALSIVVKPYIDAARIAGGGPFHIIFVHIVPNLLPLSFLYMMFTVTGAIFSEAILSFLGLLDVRMSWGLMIHTTESAGYLLQVTEYWWLIFPASLSITLLCSSFYLVGRSLDEVVNPRLRRT
ncbi:MAG: ABC transporter permease [Chloroflexi bacterium]|nr:ABC transporter permease [Chloroflexota bacterium]